MHIDVIGRDAGLPRVEIFPKYDPLRRQGKLGRLIDDTRAFSAQLQRDGDKIFRRRTHHLFPYGDAPRKENFIEFHFQQSGVLLAPARGDGDVLGGKGALDKLLNHAGDVGRIRRRLQNRGISRGERVGQRLHRQKKGIVPGAHHQHGPIGRPAHEAFRGELGKRRFHPPVPRKFFRMLHKIGNLRQRQSHLAHIAFEFPFPEIGLQRLEDIRFRPFDRRIKGFQRLDTAGGRERGAALKIAFLPLERGRKIGSAAFIQRKSVAYRDLKNHKKLLFGDRKGEKQLIPFLERKKGNLFLSFNAKR